MCWVQKKKKKKKECLTLSNAAISTTSIRPGAVEQNLLCVRGWGGLSLGADERRRERERERERERDGKVAGFALKPLLCQTCARASAAAAAAASPPLRCVSALAERRTQDREGRGGTPRRRAEQPRRSGGTARHGFRTNYTNDAPNNNNPITIIISSSSGSSTKN